MAKDDKPKSVRAAQKAGSKYFFDKKGVKKLAITAEQLKKTGLTLRQWANQTDSSGKLKKKVTTKKKETDTKKIITKKKETDTKKIITKKTGTKLDSSKNSRDAKNKRTNTAIENEKRDGDNFRSRLVRKALGPLKTSEGTRAAKMDATNRSFGSESKRKDVTVSRGNVNRKKLLENRAYNARLNRRFDPFSKFTYAQWQKMSRIEREDANLPISKAGGKIAESKFKGTGKPK